MADILQQLLESQEAARLEREKQLKALAENYQAPIDVSPLAGTLDFIYGGNSAASMRPQRDTQEDMLQQLLEEQRQPDDILNKLATAQTSGDKQDRIQARFGESEQDRMEKEVQENFSKQIMAPIDERYSQFQTMEQALKTGDINTIKMVLGQFARGISGEKGVLTDNDIARIFPTTAKQKIAQWKAFITGSADADPEIVAKANELLGYAKQNARNVYGKLINNRVNQFKARSNVKQYGIDRPGGVLDINTKQAQETLDAFAPLEEKKKEEAPKDSNKEKLKAMLRGQ